MFKRYTRRHVASLAAGLALAAAGAAVAFAGTTPRTCDPNVDVCIPDPTTATVPVNPPCPGCTTPGGGGGGGGGTTTTVATTTTRATTTTPTTTAAPPPDNDGDGITYNADNCRTTYNPDQSDDDRDGVGNACDSTPGGSAPFVAFPISGAGTEKYLDGSGATLWGCNYRWKIYTSPTVGFGYIIGKSFLKASVSFQVCYRPLIGIEWVKPAPMKSEGSITPWTWQNMNDNGFPFYTPLGPHSVQINWQGTAAICALACVGPKHPWVRFVFIDNNSGGLSSGIG